jgi:hypothetical protein
MTAEDRESGLPAFYESFHPDDYPSVLDEAVRATNTDEPFWAGRTGRTNSAT